MWSSLTRQHCKKTMIRGPLETRFMGLDSFDRWPELDRLFERALELPPDERPGFVAACSDDQELRGELVRLLEVHERADDFLEDPAAWLPDTVSSDESGPTRVEIPTRSTRSSCSASSARIRAPPPFCGR